jgi:hypothetical protein
MIAALAQSDSDIIFGDILRPENPPSPGGGGIIGDVSDGVLRYTDSLAHSCHGACHY